VQRVQSGADNDLRVVDGLGFFGGDGGGGGGG
jgi:hypothetical protein